VTGLHVGDAVTCR
jgi:threonine dehydrogenase-like Zn-dependent dehydrogenase